MPTTDRRRRADGEDRLRSILDATGALLRERPIAEISVADISARAGVVRSGFYFYFPTKGAAVAAVLGDVSDEMLAGAASFFADPDSDSDPGSADGDGGTDAIRAAMWAGWHAWSAHRDLVLGVLDARGTDPGVRGMWDAWAQRFVTAIGDELARKRERGTVRDGTDPHDLMVVLTSAVERVFERLSRDQAEEDRADDDRVAGLIETLVSVWSMAIYGTYRAPDPAPGDHDERT